MILRSLTITKPLEDTQLTVVVRISRIARARIWLGVKLMWFAAWILGVRSAAISIEDADTTETQSSHDTDTKGSAR